MSEQKQNAPTVPFDAEKLDRLMDEAGLEVLLITSKHNVQYVLGGYRFFMFDYMDAIGLSRYLPIVIYARGRLDKAGYIANPNEKFESEERGFWAPHFFPIARGTIDAANACAAHLKAEGLDRLKIGVETGFMPADAWKALARETGQNELIDCTQVLESLREIKSTAELALLRRASEETVASIAATLSAVRAGMTKQEIAEHLRQEEVSRGLIFEYCLITAGRSFNRAPSRQIIQDGDILSLDTGGNFGGYIGDLCRMGILGAPTAELSDALAEIDEIQMAARRPIQDGCNGVEIFDAVAAMAGRPRNGQFSFVAHGMGLISHEAPRLMNDGPIPYPAPFRHRPLSAGMVLSIETTWQHPNLGFLKLEDTVAVTQRGWEAYGDSSRGWTQAGC